MAHALAANVAAYRVSFWGEPDPRWQRCLQIAAGLGALTLLTVYAVPQRAVEITNVDQVSDRLAKLILEEPAPLVAPPAPAAPEVVMEKPPEIVKPEPKVDSKPEPAPIRKIPETVGKRRPRPQPIPETRGEAGRAMAHKEVTKQLDSVKSSLDRTLAAVSTSLASTDDGAAKKRSARRRRTRAGRKAEALTSAATAVPRARVSAEASKLEGTSIAIEPLETIAADGGAEAEVGGGSERSLLRSDAQLLAVVRKYADAMQWCYDNELRKTPGLGGKLLVSITIVASGRVTEAGIVEDAVGSAGLRNCALSQIEGWRFPAITAGAVTFQAPFVFTPPE